MRRAGQLFPWLYKRYGLGGRLHFSVADDGNGFEPASAGASSGLQNMTDRIGALGGRLSVRSNVGSGTVVEGTVPLSAQASGVSGSGGAAGRSARSK